VIIARQQDGTLRAFLNICRHRGAAVAYGHGAARSFVCKYHGWAYDLDGSLRKVRGGDNFGPLDTSCFGLTEVAVAERYGLVYVRATPLRVNAEPIDIDDVLGGLAPQFREWGFESGLAAPQIHDPVLTRSNWKLAVDGYLEPYHFASLHKTTVSRYNNSNQATFDAYGVNSVSGFLGRRLHELASTPEEDWALMRHVQVIYTLFPNVILSVMQDHVEASIPTSCTTCTSGTPSGTPKRCTPSASSIPSGSSPKRTSPWRKRSTAISCREDCPRWCSAATSRPSSTITAASTRCCATRSDGDASRPTPVRRPIRE
jgi:phenylpropionate dioxygenase-like ring-hydroxylating dioxygenase large terminal subunit